MQTKSGLFDPIIKFDGQIMWVGMWACGMWGGLACYNFDYFNMRAARKDACKYTQHMPCMYLCFHYSLHTMRTEQKVFPCVQYHRGKKIPNLLFRLLRLLLFRILH